MKTFILSFLGVITAIITAIIFTDIIFLIKLKINKKRVKELEIPNVTRCGLGMMQGLCSEANIKKEKNQLKRF